MLIQYVIFWKNNPEVTYKKALPNLKPRDMDNEYIKDLEILEEREYIIIQLQLAIIKNSAIISNDGWLEVSTDNFKQVINLAKRFVNKKLLNKRTQENSLKYIGSYQMIIAGSEKDYWVKPKIDIHKFKIESDVVERSLSLKDVEADNNLTIFNKILFGSKRIRGDKLSNLKLPTTIYGLGNNISDEAHQLPHTFLLNLTLDTNTKTDEAKKIQNKQFKLTINTIISNFGTLLAYLAKLIDLYTDEYVQINSKSNTIREKALALQIRINDLLTRKSDKTSIDSDNMNRWEVESNDDDEIRSWGMEEKLLLKASHYFSLLTEINQILARSNYFRNEATVNIERTSHTLGLAQMPLLTEGGKEISSVYSDFKQFTQTINFNFQNLKIELDHSQTTIRNTVDILKTFLESEQRIVSQKSSEAINWIVIVFAGLGLADALGNFVIFWLEGGSWYMAMFWFSIILIVLFMVIIVLYLWYFRKPKYLKVLD